MNPFYKEVAELVNQRVNFEAFKEKTILITGVNGLIGSHLASCIEYANQMSGLNATVIGITRSDLHPWLLDSFKSHFFKFIKQDLSCGLEAQALRELRSFKPDFIIHGATYGQPKKFLDKRFDTMVLNADVTLAFLKLAEECKANFLFASTSELYGPQDGLSPVNEEVPAKINPMDPRAAYCASKLYGEVLCQIFSESKGVTTKIARISSVYGPGVALTDDRVLNNFIMRAIQEKHLKLKDSGLQQRRWLYIADALAMIFYVLLNSSELIYNVSGDRLYSISDLAKLIAKDLGVNVEFPVESSQHLAAPGALPVINIDNKKLINESGLLPQVPLNEGLIVVRKWYQSLMI